MATVTYRKMPKDKSVGAALVLTFFFGPFGLFYSAAWWAALLMLLGAIVSGVFTMGIGAGLFWAASMIWGAIAASNKHSKYGAWLATQPQTFVAQQPQGGPGYLPLAPASAQLPWSSGDAAQGLEGSPVGASHSEPVAQRSAREGAALRELKRLCDLGLITGQEASAKRAEILSRIFASSPDDEGTVAEEQTANDGSPTDGTRALPPVPVESVPEPMAEFGPGEEVACDRTPALEAAASSPVDAQDSHPGTGPEPRRGRSRIVTLGTLALVIAIVVALGTAAYFGHFRHRGTAAKPVPLASVTSAVAVKLVLPVKVLPTQVVGGQPLSYPSNVTVRVPKRWESGLAAYGVVGRVFVVPENWSDVVKAEVYQDGSSWVELIFRNGTLPEGDLVYSSDTAVVSVWRNASVFIPWVRKNWSLSGLGGSPPCLGPPHDNPWKSPGFAEHQLSPGLIEYRYKDGPGFWTIGVAHTSLEPGHLSGPIYEQLYVQTGARDRALARVAIESFLPQIGH